MLEQRGNAPAPAEHPRLVRRPAASIGGGTRPLLHMHNRRRRWEGSDRGHSACQRTTHTRTRGKAHTRTDASSSYCLCDPHTCVAPFSLSRLPRLHTMTPSQAKRRPVLWLTLWIGAPAGFILPCNRDEPAWQRGARAHVQLHPPRPAATTEAIALIRPDVRADAVGRGGPSARGGQVRTGGADRELPQRARGAGLVPHA